MICYVLHMIITWYGEACFKIQAGEVTLKTDPFDKAGTGLTTPYFNADVVLRSNFPLAGKEREKIETDSGAGMSFYSPGEFELKGMTIRGVQVGGDSEHIETAYVIQWSDLKLVYLGYMTNSKADSRLIEVCVDTDILFIPVSKPYLESEDAVRFINQLAPKIAIPMLYNVGGLTRKAEEVSGFLKEFGVSPEVQDKLTIKKKDLESHEDTQIVVLKAQSQV